MKPAHYFSCWCFLALAVFIETVHPTCVLESDFGFKINCAFKKSGLFRVRNLGGIKAHASLGFSLGDELGFEQSLTNLDQSRRRSVSVKNGAPLNYVADTSVRPTAKQEKRGKQNRIMMRPMAPAARPSQAAMDKLSTLHRRVSSTMKPIVVPGPAVEAPTTLNRGNPSITMAKPLPMSVPPFKPIPPKEETLKVLPIVSSTRKAYTPLRVPTPKGAGPTYQSENYPHISHEQVSKMVSQMTAEHVAPSLIRITPTPFISSMQKIYAVPTTVNTFAIPTTINPFVPMPIAAPPTQALTIIPAPIFKNAPAPLAPSKTPIYLSQNSISIQKTNPISNFIDPVPHQVHDLASMYPGYNTKKVDDYNSISGYGDDTMLKFNKEDINAKIAEIAKAGNISMEAVEAAIALRQQQLLNKYANLPMPTTTTPTTTTTTTEEPLVFQPEPEPEIVVAAQKPKRNPTIGKVMNAPKEYYPVGYEKNFDDHFQTKVDLPDTNFHCGDQKYFPGLYGDESLGCMVFHVCALTDDGLVMKSFLCPESTLFDQTILKCNWWFYVDCKNTRRLYDTNIPVSKSYQLMKALTFFSSYKKEMQEDGHSVNPEDVVGIKEAISILENQDTKPAAVNDATLIQIVTPRPYLDERSNHKGSISNETSPVYRGNRNYNETSTRLSSKRKSPESQYKSPGPHRTDPEQHKIERPIGNPEFKLVTVNADMSFNKPANSVENTSKETSEENSSNRKHRRRMTLKNNSNLVSNQTSTTTQAPFSTLFTTPTVDTIKQTSTFILNNNETRQFKLSDQLESADSLSPITAKDVSDSPPVKRFYRSSSENTNNKAENEMTLMNNEKVQIIRPTSIVKLVGEHPTSTATIAKLDAAILGSSSTRIKKEVTMVVPQRQESIRSSTYRHRT